MTTSPISSQPDVRGVEISLNTHFILPWFTEAKKALRHSVLAEMQLKFNSIPWFIISVTRSWKGASAMWKGALPESSNHLNYARMKNVWEEVQFPIRQKN